MTLAAPKALKGAQERASIKRSGRYTAVVSRWPLYALLVSVATTAGCSGSDGYGCDAQFRYLPKASYAGAYSASFTPLGGTSPTRTFDLRVSEPGVVTGTATRSGERVAVAGTAGDLRSRCVYNRTGLVLHDAIASEASQTLVVERGRDGAFRGSYRGTLTTSGEAVVGNLAVTDASE